MILGLPQDHPADLSERRLPDAAAARALLPPDDAIEDLLARRRRGWAAHVGAEPFARVADAVRLAYARLALRHGRLGDDFHAYHNEGHVLDICGTRIDRLEEAVGFDALAPREWCALLLFGACHDLRQREGGPPLHGIGANERASIEEGMRVLDAAGFSRTRDADLHLALELTIAGSTFDARVPKGLAYTAADFVQSGGALAARLDQILDERRPGWRGDAAITRAQRLALIAADLDTANVAEPFARFARSGEHLCREREKLSGRTLDSAASALPALGFLTDGQQRFFFELHRFQSEAGRAAFEAAKQANAAPLKALTAGVRARIAMRGVPPNGEAVIAAYREAAERFA